MSATSPKIVMVGFLTQPANSLMLHKCEALYVYGVMSQLSRFTTATYRDMCTLSDRISVVQELGQPETMRKLAQICKATRGQYVFTGSIRPATAPQSQFEIEIRLFDATQGKYIVEEQGCLPLSVKDSEVALPYSAEALNQLINQTVSQIAQAVFGQRAGLEAHILAPYSQSLNAMQLMLKAHQASSSAEKISFYEAVIQEDPNLESAYCQLAKIYKNEKKYEKSVVFYRETLKHSVAAMRNQAVYATDAGISCALLGRADLALQWWKRAIQYDPDYINPYFNIANTCEDQERYAEAEAYFLRAQELAPNDFRTFFNLARIYSKMGFWEKALTQYNYQLKTEDKDPWCHSDVATCYLNLGDKQNAMQHLRETVKLDPGGEAGEYAQLILSSLA
jgi:tetratricopeptide (TPR) repeat protein